MVWQCDWPSRFMMAVAKTTTFRIMVADGRHGFIRAQVHSNGTCSSVISKIPRKHCHLGPLLRSLTDPVLLHRLVISQPLRACPSVPSRPKLFWKAGPAEASHVSSSRAVRAAAVWRGRENMHHAAKKSQEAGEEGSGMGPQHSALGRSYRDVAMAVAIQR